jgi:hypothetical protein
MPIHRRKFLQQSVKAGIAMYAGANALSAKSYANIIGANDKVRVGVVGFSDRFKYSLLPAFMQHQQELNFDIVAVSDIWRLKREWGTDYLKLKMAHDMMNCMHSKIWMR